MKKYTISGLEHMVKLIATKPELLNLSSLAPLQTVIAKTREASKGCAKCKIPEIYRSHKKDFELALNNLAYGDHLVVKKLFNVDQICYYVKNAAGGLVLKCI